MRLRSIKPKKIRGQVFKQLKKLISRGEIKQKRQLLPKHALADNLQVSRTRGDDVINQLNYEPDAAFHMAVIFARKHPVLIHLMRNFYEYLFTGIKYQCIPTHP